MSLTHYLELLTDLYNKEMSLPHGTDEEISPGAPGSAPTGPDCIHALRAQNSSLSHSETPLPLEHAGFDKWEHQ